MADFQPLMSHPHPYPHDLTIPQFLLDSPSHPLRPTRLAGSRWLVDDDTSRAYGLEEIRERVERVARGIRAQFGVGEGDVVCLFSQNHIDYPIVIWALHRLGAVVSCANPSYTAGELTYQLRETSSKLLFTSPSALPTALAATAEAGLFSQERVVVFGPPPPEPQLDGQGCFFSSQPEPTWDTKDGQFLTVQQISLLGWHSPPNYVEPRGPMVGDSVAFLSFSSGTTGLPKSIAIAHRNLIANVIQVVAHNRTNEEGLSREDRFAMPGEVALGVLPMYHIYGLVVNLHVVLFSGLALVVVPRFVFKNILESIVRHRVSHLYIVPPMVVMMLNNPLTKSYDLSHLRFAMVGAAPLSREVTERFKKQFPRVRMGQGYGMTETCTVVCQFEFQKESVNGSAGKLIPHTQARIILPSGRPAGPGEPGELWVKGPQTALYYPNNKAATEETFLPDGWVRTGDEALITKEGDVYVLDRLKEFLKVNGFQVAPAELEGHLVVHPYVSDAGVVGIPDDMRGEVPIAFVVLSPEGKAAASGAGAAGEGNASEEIKKWVRDQKVRYKWLEGGVVFVDAIPKNTSGKILRRLLRDQAKEIVQARKKGMVVLAKL
ncbi:phenylacetyl-CoA ligase [Dacryopinax primogenitus]|uniref:Phenylacetyl-CoA ligase n=2 Tax=Dacryopinax primogenitus (strain DJM 731) TaxID=1858805 RepID=M5FYA1_DACPD|nr:phenylacetyl-CoA ligase [Dacryopinax primogenitus]EJT96507.1 phenylacetyl-CoA ligase [Dacryopinax primogenitus]